MKKLSVLAVFAIALVIAACGSKETKNSESTAAKVESRNSGGLKIAYYNQDSLKMHFEYYREKDSIVTKKQLAFQKELQRRSSELQNYIIRNDERARGGLLSENEIMQIQQTVQQREAEIMDFQQREGAKLEEETFRELEVIGNKIEHFGKKYCEENEIDILLVMAPGGQINYISPSMDVTKEFTQYLNENQAALQNDIEK